ncbi:MAG TPA: LPS export ABC transporter periplasmic protein LptC [Flavobacteriales bacterium]|jgi:LPS export ABC transporter protein LptC|nr:LPS export ABC transporter periplasmic protein LptC [Flavobacteriales bacterium]
MHLRGWAIGFFALALVACKNDLDRVAAIEVPTDAPDRVTTDAEYFYSDSGHVRNRLRAGTISEHMIGDAPYTDLDNGVELTFYDAQGRPGSVLTARRGHVWNKERRMEVDEQVVFTNPRGERLETEQLIWEQDSGRVHTERPVRITRAHDIIYGQGLDAAQDFSRYTVRRVTGTLALERSDTLAPADR